MGEKTKSMKIPIGSKYINLKNIPVVLVLIK